MTKLEDITGVINREIGALDSAMTLIKTHDRAAQLPGTNAVKKNLTHLVSRLEAQFGEKKE